jgi:hypothetical protein
MKKAFFTLLLLSFLVMPIRANNITFTSPAGGEVWVRGSQKMITFNLADDAPGYEMVLKRNGVFVGYVYANSYGENAGVINRPWEVGKVKNEDEIVIWAPIGSGYTLCAGCWGSGPPPYGVSNSFSIGFDFTFIGKFKQIAMVPELGCPECFVLDLKDLREELVKLDDQVVVGLYWRNEKIASFGKIGKGQGWPGKQEIRLEPGPKASMSRGGEFELRIFTDHHQLLHSQKIVLVAGR